MRVRIAARASPLALAEPTRVAGLLRSRTPTSTSVVRSAPRRPPLRRPAVGDRQGKGVFAAEVRAARWHSRRAGRRGGALRWDLRPRTPTGWSSLRARRGDVATPSSGAVWSTCPPTAWSPPARPVGGCSSRTCGPICARICGDMAPVARFPKRDDVGAVGVRRWRCTAWVWPTASTDVLPHLRWSAGRPGAR